MSCMTFYLLVYIGCSIIFTADNQQQALRPAVLPTSTCNHQAVPTAVLCYRYTCSALSRALLALPDI